MAVAHHFHFKFVADPQLFTLLQQVHQPVTGQLHRHAPACHPLFLQNFQRRGVITVQAVSGDKRQPALVQHINHAEIMSFDHKFAVIHQFGDLFQLGRGL